METRIGITAFEDEGSHQTRMEMKMGAMKENGKKGEKEKRHDMRSALLDTETDI